MKNFLVVAMLLSALSLTASVMGWAQTRPDFSGTWSLDLKRSGEVPAALKSYSLTVKQDGQQITVDAKVEGDINPVALTDHTAPQPHAIPLATTSGITNSDNGVEAPAMHPSNAPMQFSHAKHYAMQCVCDTQ